MMISVGERKSASQLTSFLTNLARSKRNNWLEKVIFLLKNRTFKAAYCLQVDCQHNCLTTYYIVNNIKVLFPIKKSSKWSSG